MASIFGRSIIVPLTNKSGGGVVLGDVVVVDTTTDESFTTTTSAANTSAIGVAAETIANNAVGRVIVGGYASLVNVNASVTRNQFGTTHTVAKQATGTASRAAGTFCRWLKTSATPSAYIYPVDLAGAALTNPMTAVGDIIQGTTAGAPAALAAVATGKVLVSQGVTTSVAWGYPPFHGCRAVNTAGTSIADSTLTAIPFAAADLYDTDNWHDTVTNNTRITPTIAGKYRIGGTITFATGSATGMRLIAVRLNGTTYIALDQRSSGAGLGSEEFLSIATEYTFNGSTDYAELIGYQTTGSPAPLSSNTTYGGQFWMSLAGV